MFAVKMQLFYCLYIWISIETTNYVEHYGLMRKKDDKGVYESINAKHSWNASKNYSNLLMFKI
jgi:alkane 1-monooxygenase